ncbi:MAG: M18 family aminopeptidase, partial [Ezakiella massiliensis]
MDIKTFFDKSKLNFEAMDNLSAMLDEAGFERLNEEDKWDLKSGGKYYVIKNETSLFAFRMGKDKKKGFTIVGSHSDSPGFRIKPNPEIVKEDVVVLNTEVYGGPLLYTWFDRPLSIGGKVTVDSGDPLKPKVIKYRSKENLMVIPSVAIHMNREANKGWEINPQEHTLPVVGLDKDFKLIPYIEKEIGEKIISHELYLINDNDFEYVGV